MIVRLPLGGPPPAGAWDRAPGARLALWHLFPRGADAALRRVAVLNWTHTRPGPPGVGPLRHLLLWTVDGIMESWVPDRLASRRLALLAQQGWTPVEVGRPGAGTQGHGPPQEAGPPPANCPER